jgi:hypothetical protein
MCNLHIDEIDLETINEINLPDEEEWLEWASDLETANIISEATTLILVQTYECDYSDL